MSPTFYGRTAKAAAASWAERLGKEITEGFASGRTGNWCHIAMPWDELSVQQADEGYAVFVEERDGDPWLASRSR